MKDCLLLSSKKRFLILAFKTVLPLKLYLVLLIRAAVIKESISFVCFYIRNTLKAAYWKGKFFIEFVCGGSCSTINPT